MCTNPKWIYKKGNYKENNYRGMAGEEYELGTYSKCGSCSQCISEKANNWVIRNYYEAENEKNKEKCFITLTYKNSPFFLVRKDLQDWAKRFRKEINKEYLKELNWIIRKAKKVWDTKEKQKEVINEWKEDHKDEYIKTRMFYAGEYGDLNGRPHYHVIIYGWEDKQRKYLDINKKGNIIYQSKIIHKTWGKGRTSYQEFGDGELPYVTLYNTAQETFKKAYKISREKAKKLQDIIMGSKNWDTAQRKNMLQELNEAIKEMDEQKNKYLAIKEFNGWSLALGWEEFYKRYLETEGDYVFTEYVNGAGEFATPSPWVKKLANMGYRDAAEEMFKREEDIIKSATTKEERYRNLLKIWEKKKREILEWDEQKNGVESL